MQRLSCITTFFFYLLPSFLSLLAFLSFFFHVQWASFVCLSSQPCLAWVVVSGTSSCLVSLSFLVFLSCLTLSTLVTVSLFQSLSRGHESCQSGIAGPGNDNLCLWIYFLSVCEFVSVLFCLRTCWHHAMFSSHLFFCLLVLSCLVLPCLISSCHTCFLSHAFLILSYDTVSTW